MTYTNVQNTPGTRVTSGATNSWTVTKQYASDVTTGNMLMAFVSRLGSANQVPTIGSVSDDQGNHWRQAVEFLGGTGTTLIYGIDLWICESCTATGTAPTVTATQLGYPDGATMVGLNIQVMEWSGCSGYELTDQIGQAHITTTSVTATTNFNLAANNELAISAVIGNMSAATIPSGWSSLLADTTQKCYLAYKADTGGSSSGSTLSAAWTGLTGATTGAGFIATFVQTGVPSTAPHLVQSCYTDRAIGIPRTATVVSQPFPTNPTPGNTLVSVMSVAVYTGGIQSFPVLNVTDTAGNTWRWAGESGVDEVSGVDLCLWVCANCKGGATTLTLTPVLPTEAGSFWLGEFANLSHPIADSIGRSQGSDSATTSSAVLIKDAAIAFKSYVVLSGTLAVAPQSGWTMVMSDTAGDGHGMMNLNVAAGVLTATFSAGSSAADMLLTALRPALGVAAH